jgi:hypothetical protein
VFVDVFVDVFVAEFVGACAFCESCREPAGLSEISAEAIKEIIGYTGFECTSNARYASTMREFLRNAFALDDGKPCEPSPEQRAVLERVADEIARRRMTSTAIAFLEMSRPLQTLGSATIHFMTPIASSLANPLALKHFAEFLEKRGAVDVLANMLEEAETRLNQGCCESDAGSESGDDLAK